MAFKPGQGFAFSPGFDPGKTALMTGAQFALRNSRIKNRQLPIPAAKCPFKPQREMITKLWGTTGSARPIQGTLF